MLGASWLVSISPPVAACCCASDPMAAALPCPTMFSSSVRISSFRSYSQNSTLGRDLNLKKNNNRGNCDP